VGKGAVGPSPAVRASMAANVGLNVSERVLSTHKRPWITARGGPLANQHGTFAAKGSSGRRRLPRGRRIWAASATMPLDRHGLRLPNLSLAQAEREHLRPAPLVELALLQASQPPLVSQQRPYPASALNIMTTATVQPHYAHDDKGPGASQRAVYVHATDQNG
jgi:hypothetical protein